MLQKSQTNTILFAVCKTIFANKSSTLLEAPRPASVRKTAARHEIPLLFSRQSRTISALAVPETSRIAAPQTVLQVASRLFTLKERDVAPIYPHACAAQQR